MALDELERVGVERMTDGEVRDFLASQGMGVLGLPAEGAPYLLPMSFGYDGDRTLYFSYLVGETSRKTDLTERASTATFLVYTASSPFVWQSVRLTGRLERVPDDAVDEVADALGNAWRPAVFEEAELERGFRVYRLPIDEQVGVKHTGLPPGIGGEEM
jgi:nitroimidazol reductase NimA-like FMN-containing flavoprotein (pyridoxamine 5'-phosphate oxidase superfamily)